jgi:heme/copper-type cytochrome/quinol oxidase subunit 2
MQVARIVKGIMRDAVRMSVACLFSFTLQTTTRQTTVPTVNAQTSVEMTLTDAGISPSSMSASKDQPVSIHVVNRGTKTHNLVIPAFYIFTSNLNPGSDTFVRFSPDKTGTFPYYSDTGGKPEPGIHGSITVR